MLLVDPQVRQPVVKVSKFYVFLIQFEILIYKKVSSLLLRMCLTLWSIQRLPLCILEQKCAYLFELYKYFENVTCKRWLKFYGHLLKIYKTIDQPTQNVWRKQERLRRDWSHRRNDPQEEFRSRVDNWKKSQEKLLKGRPKQ